VGNVLDAAGITIGNTVQRLGRGLAFGGTITADTDTITVPNCTVPSGTGTLNIIKTVLGGGSLVASDFILTINSGGVFYASGVGSAGTSYLLPEGTYTVSEAINASYTDTYSNTYTALLDCSNIVIASGSVETCTVINTYIIPPSGGGGG
jgi:hypothetical protein